MENRGNKRIYRSAIDDGIYRMLDGGRGARRDARDRSADAGPRKLSEQGRREPPFGGGAHEIVDGQVGVDAPALKVHDARGEALCLREVVRAEHLGDQTRLHLNISGHSVVTLADPHKSYSAAEPIKIAPVNPLYFDHAGLRVQ